MTKLQIKSLGFESFRDFYTELGQWLYRNDFTYTGADNWSERQLIAEFVYQTQRAKSKGEAHAFVA